MNLWLTILLMVLGMLLVAVVILTIQDRIRKEKHIIKEKGNFKEEAISTLKFVLEDISNSFKNFFGIIFAIVIIASAIAIIAGVFVGFIWLVKWLWYKLPV